MRSMRNLKNLEKVPIFIIIVICNFFLIGNLFKYTRKSVVKKDLVIFVTPRIIRNYMGNVDISEAPIRIAKDSTKSESAQQPEAKDEQKAESAAQRVESQPAQEAPAPAMEPVAEPVAEEPAPEQEPVYEEPAPEAPAAPAAEVEDDDDGWD